MSTIERYHGVEAVWVECRSVNSVCSGSVVAVHVSVYRKSNVCCTAMASRLSSVDSHPVWYAGVVVLWYSVVSQLLATVLGTL